MDERDASGTGGTGEGDVAPEPRIRTLLLLALPALAVGVGSALTLWLLDLASEALQALLWETIPDAMGLASGTAWWTIAVLTATGLLVGLTVRFVPGHGGADSATTEFDSPPPRVSAVPGIALAVVLGLAGGVSLGPENPIIAVNGALAVAAFSRMSRAVPQRLVVTLAVAGTIGALFGTPVAAALVLTAAVAAIRGGGSLWDKLFLPVASAAAGALTMRLLGVDSMQVDVAPYTDPQLLDLATGFAVAAASALLGIAAAVVFPYLHRLFHALRNPVVFTTLGGAMLGALAVLGGPLTMFKGLEQTAELVHDAGRYTLGALLLLAVIKVIALLVAASSGFRGGRIFPAIFAGVAVGLAGHALIPGIPMGLAIACGVLGIVLVATRDGWIAIFLALALTGDIALLPLLCVITLPTWLLVSKAPHLEIEPERAGAPVQ